MSEATWQTEDGSVRLYLADCLDVLPTLEAGSVDCVVTSPPYNLKKKWWDSGANGIHVELARKFADEWYDDEIPEEEYQRQQREMLAQSDEYAAARFATTTKFATPSSAQAARSIRLNGPAALICGARSFGTADLGQP
jgi:hypothetical protein